jgi:S1-C subfamily serine protease
VAGGAAVGRGQRVAAFGYPGGEAVGVGLKLTTGVISGVPERGTGQMLLLDVKVNPGNSGGPLCDPAGNVVGVVTAKSVGGFGVDSYGMAVPARDVEEFLKKHVKGYRSGAVHDRALPWNEVDRLVSPSVVMILNAKRR